MKKIFTLLVTSLLIHSLNAWSTPIILSNVPGIEQLEWMPLNSSLGFSRDQVEAQLSSGGLFDGWHYANRTEVAALLQSYWPGNYSGWTKENSPAAKFIQLFGNTDSQNPGQSVQFLGLDGMITWDYRMGAVFYYGANNECFGAPPYTCLGVVNVLYSSGTAVAGFLDNEYGLDPTGSTQGALSSEAQPTRASLLVRQATVPEPSTILLILLGIGLFAIMRSGKVGLVRS